MGDAFHVRDGYATGFYFHGRNVSYSLFVFQACGGVFQFAIPTSIHRSEFIICSGLYRVIGINGRS
jgi:hypothetical protein